MSIWAGPDGKWCTPEPVSAQGPVFCLLQEIPKTSVFQVIRHPIHLFVVGQQLLSEFRYLYEPPKQGIVKQWSSASVTERVGVNLPLRAEQTPVLLQLAQYLGISIFEKLPSKRQPFIVKMTRGIYGVDYLYTHSFANFKVINSEGWGSMHNPCALLKMNVVSRDDC